MEESYELIKHATDMNKYGKIALLLGILESLKTNYSELYDAEKEPFSVFRYQNSLMNLILEELEELFPKPTKDEQV
jgi:hypothetical protein